MSHAWCLILTMNPYQQQNDQSLNSFFPLVALLAWLQYATCPPPLPPVFPENSFHLLLFLFIGFESNFFSLFTALLVWLGMRRGIRLVFLMCMKLMNLLSLYSWVALDTIESGNCDGSSNFLVLWACCNHSWGRVVVGSFTAEFIVYMICWELKLVNLVPAKDTLTWLWNSGVIVKLMEEQVKNHKIK